MLNAPKVAVCVCLSSDNGRPEPETCAVITGACLLPNTPIGTVLWGMSGSIFIGRERAGQWMQHHKDFTHLLFWDSDIVPKTQAVQQLLDHQLYVVSGFYVSKGLPCEPIAYYDTGDGKLAPFMGRKLEKCAAAGLGFCLIRREVFDLVAPPWFEAVAEDFHFFKQLHKHNIQPWVDFGVECGHIGRWTYGRGEAEVAARRMGLGQQGLIIPQN